VTVAAKERTNPSSAARATDALGDTRRCYAVCALGLEKLLASELGAMAIGPHAVDGESGGVEFDASLRTLYEANLRLRTASRLLVRLGTFHVRALGELERRARELPWERYIMPGRSVRVRVTSRKSRLYHTGAIAERVAVAMTSRSGGVAESAGSGSGSEAGAGRVAAVEDDAPDGESQLVVVRVFHDRCTISIDSSGALLHRRGYRLATAKAPLRETLAAALLLASEWDARSPLLDPMCGSGTIVIEAALMARRIAPGSGRDFAFQTWPDFDPALWESVLADAHARILPAAPCRILGSDRDAGAVAAAIANAERAGVAGDVEFTRRALSAIDPPAEPGWVVTNPPYGSRMGSPARLRNLYAQLGKVLRTRCDGWRVALLSADRRLETSMGIRLSTALETRNGGIAVRASTGVVDRL
jgi:putative N6-adenine-specific DNA methylase